VTGRPEGYDRVRASRASGQGSENLDPRLPPIPVADYQEFAATQLGEARPEESQVLNISRTLAHNPELMLALRPYHRHLNESSTLPRRDQELAILRVSWRCNCAYVFGQHRLIGARHGISGEDVMVAVQREPASDAASSTDCLVLRTVDELYDDNLVSESVWSALAATYSSAQILELLSVIGRYWTVSCLVNALRIQPEPGTPGFP
jgi:4-carboxymuconolactone decarboxylase